ncbi:MAG: hypothetical protein ABSB76_31945 [Streptosporangiaceae bacterium]
MRTSHLTGSKPDLDDHRQKEIGMSDLAETADVIVVGGGSAGAVLERVYQRVYAAATRRLP